MLQHDCFSARYFSPSIVSCPVGPSALFLFCWTLYYCLCFLQLFQQHNNTFNTPCSLFLLLYTLLIPLTVGFLFSMALSLPQCSLQLPMRWLIIQLPGFSVTVASSVSSCSQDTFIHKRGPNTQRKITAS